jgi:hypothetical protein
VSSTINWLVAKANTEELRRLDAGVDTHPFARFVYLAFRPMRGQR